MRVLVSDDQQDVLEAIRLLLKGAGHQAEIVDSPRSALSAAEGSRFDLILMDMNYSRDTTSGDEGLALLDNLQKHDGSTPVIVMTAWSSVDLAVEAMRRGAVDFIQKPWDNARLLATIEKQAHRSKERKNAKSELEIARHVQQRLLPQHAQTLKTITLGGRCLPAREIGGDYYDFLELGPGRVGVLLADVSGKGVAGALLTASLQASFRSQLELGVKHGKALLTSVNKLFHESTPAEYFATMFYAEYRDQDRELRYINCGHPAALLMRSTGAIERLEASALPIGIFSWWKCEEKSVPLAPGDVLLVVSDGVLEAGVEQGEEFGEARLIAATRSGPADVEGLLEHILGEVQRFSPGAQGDDVTIVGLRGQ
ncbi:MAG TPA: SpoIIE family protein phosphatase [Bryobacteraceae bacterium]|jgi:sigma-B regulation protein RsbU (phosphoserine phosphatase)|nr:SpoIIE family protein phosphatase [Bryobacteraceae bacterium]